MRDFADQMIEAARELAAAVECIKFKPPVTHVYNPLNYAWRAHVSYLKKFAGNRKRVVFLGMNPGPFGMVQTGVPFGEINAVRDWMRITATIDPPRRQHSKRPVEGFACPRSEVSGRRLWGLFADRFGSAEDFFADHFVINYCPLAFFDDAGRNVTPDKLPARQTARLFAACDLHLRRAVENLRPEWLIGIGDFAAKRALLLLAEIVPTQDPPSASAGERPRVGLSPFDKRKLPPLQASLGETALRCVPGQMPALQIGKILHPSPASPAANKNWARKATDELKALGIWK